MLNRFIAFLCMFSGLVANAQDSEPWFAFPNKDSSLIGFKDTTGAIRIAPKFMGLTAAKKFEHIMAVMETGTYRSYYLTKNGKETGVDSLYVSDITADCESEGFIRFRDPESQLAGMLDKHGTVVIPAQYNNLSRVNNGLVVALKGARKEYWDGHRESGCTHFSWKGGTQYLLNTNYEILVENFAYDGYPDFFSLTIGPEPLEDPERVSFQGKNGQYYSFADHRKVFDKVLKRLLSDDLGKEEFEKLCYDSIYYSGDPYGWISEAKEPFADRNFELIKNRFLHLTADHADYHIFVHGLNPYIYQEDEFSIYFNNCEEAKEVQYPVMNVVINTKNAAGEPVQDHFDFLKTVEGYRLLSVLLRTGKW